MGKMSLTLHFAYQAGKRFVPKEFETHPNSLTSVRTVESKREALSSYLREERKEKDDYFSFVGIAEGPKKGKTSEQAEEILREARSLPTIESTSGFISLVSLIP
ncbi:MAG: hypothetical protein HZA07_01435 [Nitrospirae bacterium]|nr:hypothetical protein [Nitrospirota bacterium]